MNIKISLNKNFKLLSDRKSPYNQPNFSAFIFVSFFYKTKKILTFPLFFFIIPWGFDQIYKNVQEETYLFEVEEDEESDIKFYRVNKKHNFYLGTFSDGESQSSDFKFGFWFGTYFSQTSSCEEAYEKLSKFELFMKESVFSVLVNLSEEVKFKILSFVETEIGPLEEIALDSLEDTDFSYITEKVGRSNINFCKDIPSKLEINLEDHFSEQELLEFIKVIEQKFALENPFTGEIETSIEEYKEFLLSLVGPGKLEFTNLEIEKLDLSIEELFFLFRKLEHSASALIDEKEEKATWQPLFFPDDKEISTRYDLFTRYFWYKIKQAVSNKN